MSSESDTRRGADAHASAAAPAASPTSTTSSPSASSGHTKTRKAHRRGISVSGHVDVGLGDDLVASDGTPRVVAGVAFGVVSEDDGGAGGSRSGSGAGDPLLAELEELSKSSHVRRRTSNFDTMKRASAVVAKEDVRYGEPIAEVYDEEEEAQAARAKQTRGGGGGGGGVSGVTGEERSPLVSTIKRRLRRSIDESNAPSRPRMNRRSSMSYVAAAGSGRVSSALQFWREQEAGAEMRKERAAKPRESIVSFGQVDMQALMKKFRQESLSSLQLGATSSTSSPRWLQGGGGIVEEGEGEGDEDGSDGEDDDDSADEATLAMPALAVHVQTYASPVRSPVKGPPPASSASVPDLSLGGQLLEKQRSKSAIHDAPLVEAEEVLDEEQLEELIPIPFSTDPNDYPDPIRWPDSSSDLTVELVESLVHGMYHYGSQPYKLRELFPEEEMAKLLRQAQDTFRELGNVNRIMVPADTDVQVCIIGDTHGQFYDVVNLLTTLGYPSPTQWYLFNGDLIDRGSWGVELATTAFALKLLFPRYVFVTRGNHETTYCAKVYGFHTECQSKYSNDLYGEFVKTFCLMPLAAVVLPAGEREMEIIREHYGGVCEIPVEESEMTLPSPLLPLAPVVDEPEAEAEAEDEVEEPEEEQVPPPDPDDPPIDNSYSDDEYYDNDDDWDDSPPPPPPTIPMGANCGVMVLHGGLFRKPDNSLGTIADLVSCDRTSEDPQGSLVEDILWSDPERQPGHGGNTMRGCGTMYGSDVVKYYLELHGLSLLVRSHEGPDARAKRPYMVDDMMRGFAVDHSYEDTDEPLTITVFSAPDYPQGPKHMGNTGAVLQVGFETVKEEEVLISGEGGEAQDGDDVDAVADYRLKRSISNAHGLSGASVLPEALLPDVLNTAKLRLKRPESPFRMLIDVYQFDGAPRPDPNWATIDPNGDLDLTE